MCAYRFQTEIQQVKVVWSSITFPQIFQQTTCPPQTVEW